MNCKGSGFGATKFTSYSSLSVKYQVESEGELNDVE